NDYGETNLPPGLSSVVAISAGNGFNLALLGEEVSAPQIVGYARTEGGFSMKVQSVRGRSYFLEFKNSLSDASWQMVPPVPGDGTVRTLIDPAAKNEQRFYQVRIQ